LVGARNRALGEAAVDRLRGESVDTRHVQVDLIEPATIMAAAADIDSRKGRLDILVNNAGISTPGDLSPGVASLEAVRRTFETNFFGSFAVTQAMLPLLKRSASGRIVNVSSGLGSLTQIGDSTSEFAALRLIGYGASKAALNMLTVQLVAELKASGIKVNSADPRYTATDLNGSARPHRREQRRPSVWRFCQTMAPPEGSSARTIRSRGRP
jgi:NAD(P)-dependent dehydrogenase (short-subunit alcohol dehydrogenase family)